MNTQKLARALKKELTRNPKKTIALGLVTVVALWFWAPLAIKWFGKGKSKAKPAAVASAAAPAIAQPTVGESAGALPSITPQPTELRIVWNELLDRMSRDEHMQSATLKPESRDPFATTAVESKVTQNTAEQTPGSAAPTVVRADASPSEVGLILQGTLVSSNRRRATITGRTYGIGDKVLAKPPASSEPGVSASDPVEFEVSEIEPTRVVLSRKNKPYELKLVRETLADGDRLSFGDSR